MPTPGDVSTGESGPDLGLEELLDRFEEAWQQGLRPLLEDYLPPGEPSPLLLASLAQVDLERRLKAGEAVRVEEYLQRFRALAGDPNQAFALVLREYQLRRRLELGLSTHEYLLRFPHYARQLEEHLPAEPPTHIEGSPAPPRLITEDGRLTSRAHFGEKPRTMGVDPYQAAVHEVGERGIPDRKRPARAGLDTHCVSSSPLPPGGIMVP